MRCGFAAFVTAVGMWTAVALAAAPDLNSPRACLESLYAAVKAQDAGAMTACMVVSEPRRAMMNAIVELILSGRHLTEAARERFAAAGESLGRDMLTPRDSKEIDRAEVKIDGDGATLTLPEESRPLEFRRGDDGKWRLWLGDYFVPSGSIAAPDQITAQTSLLSEFAKTMRDAADEIRTGKYDSAEDARTAIEGRFHEVMIRALRTHPPASRPATRP